MWKNKTKTVAVNHQGAVKDDYQEMINWRDSRLKTGDSKMIVEVLVGDWCLKEPARGLVPQGTSKGTGASRNQQGDWAQAQPELGER